MKLIYKVDNYNNESNNTSYYKTVKDVILQFFKVSNRLLTKLKKENSIYLNDIPCNINTLIKPNDIITISFDYLEDNSNIVSTKMDINIIYEDDCYIIINKPYGIPVHPSISHYADSLSNGLKYYYDSNNIHKKIRPINRIDKDTSGLVIFAKNEYIQESLIRQMQSNTFKKEYIAIVNGLFDKSQGVINKPISRKENSIIERCINDDGQPSITHFEVLNNNNDKNYSIVKCILETGRTHQIRVHMKSIGHSLLGDDLYGGNKDLINRQALHCYKLSFIHPISNKNVSYISELPYDMKQLLN